MGDEKERFARYNRKSGVSLYHGAKTKVQVGSELSQKFLIQVGVYQESVLSPLLFAIAVDVISENAREELMIEILYADDLAIMSESIENLKEKFLKWKEAFESKKLKVNLKKTKVMIIGSKDEVLKSKVDPCVKCGKRVMANSAMCTKGGKWVHGRCTKMKRVISTLEKVSFVNYVFMQRKEWWNQMKNYHFLTRLTL